MRGNLKNTTLRISGTIAGNAAGRSRAIDFFLRTAPLSHLASKKPRLIRLFEQFPATFAGSVSRTASIGRFRSVSISKSPPDLDASSLEGLTRTLTNCKVKRDLFTALADVRSRLPVPTSADSNLLVLRLLLSAGEAYVKLGQYEDAIDVMKDMVVPADEALTHARRELLLGHALMHRNVRARCFCLHASVLKVFAI